MPKSVTETTRNVDVFQTGVCSLQLNNIAVVQKDVADYSAVC